MLSSEEEEFAGLVGTASEVNPAPDGVAAAAAPAAQPGTGIEALLVGVTWVVAEMGGAVIAAWVAAAAAVCIVTD